MRVTHLYHFQLKIYTCGSKIYYLLLMKHMPMSHFFSFMFLRKQPLEMLCKKRIYKVFANFTGKHLCWSLFFNKVAGWRSYNRFKNYIIDYSKLKRIRCILFGFPVPYVTVINRNKNQRHLIWLNILGTEKDSSFS